MQQSRHTNKQAENWIEKIELHYPDAVRSAILFNEDTYFNSLTQSVPILLIIVHSEEVKISQIIKTCDIQPCKELYPFIISEKESAQLQDLQPLDLLHMKSSSRKIYGSDLLQSQDISKELLKHAAIAKIQSTLWHMRSISATLDKADYRAALQEVLQRLYPSWKATLLLLGSPIPTQWVQLLSSIESRCNLNTFVLTRAIAILESPKKSSYKKEPTLFEDLQDALGKIILTLELS